ncbi:early protein [Bacillus phage BSP2]|uniref:Terminase small subunit n=1 Tax=Bacillus phage BSTP4 TaxID=2801529 RepID=A0A7T8IVF3_9CAUD|nr:early protein [Bacillus phage BSP4]AYJ76501.1 early protein [Bacillus phage BSP2]QQO90060.1 terminase small subunit [Bacillus phage BSTP4]
MNNYQLTINEVITIINTNTEINKLVAKKENLYPTDLYDLDKQALINIILNSDFALSSIKRALLEVTVEELGTQDNDEDDYIDDELEDLDGEIDRVDYVDKDGIRLDVPRETSPHVDKSIVTFNDEPLDEANKIAESVQEHDFDDKAIEEAELKTFKNHLPSIYSMKKENK